MSVSPTTRRNFEAAQPELNKEAPDFHKRFAKITTEINQRNARNRTIFLTLCVIAILALLAYAGYGFYIK